LLNNFYKCCIQQNPLLVVSQLMHNIHCGGLVFPYLALERLDKRLLIGCAGLRILNLKASNIHPVKCLVFWKTNHVLNTFYLSYYSFTFITILISVLQLYLYFAF
jgi:hypothetical protein